MNPVDTPIRARTGLALGSGAARGLCYIGVLDALERRGIRIDCIAGTSVGALIGALYASGIPARQLQRIAENLNWRRLARLVGPTLPTTGLLDNRKVGNFIDELLPVKTFDALKLPLAVTATDIESGAPIVIRDGRLLPAIQASIAFPGLFQPAPFGDRFLVDGGLWAPVPTDVVRTMGADRVIGVCAIPPVEKRFQETSVPANGGQGDRPAGRKLTVAWIERRFREIWQSTSNHAAGECSRRPPSIFHIFTQSVAILENQINTLRLERDSVEVLIRPELKGITLLEFHRAAEAINAGRKEAFTVLDSLSNQLPIAETSRCATMQEHGMTRKKEDKP